MQKRYTHVFNIFLAVFLVFTACAPPNQSLPTDIPKPQPRQPILLGEDFKPELDKHSQDKFEGSLSRYTIQGYPEPEKFYYVGNSNRITGEIIASYSYADFLMPSTEDDETKVGVSVQFYNFQPHPVTGVLIATEARLGVEFRDRDSWNHINGSPATTFVRNFSGGVYLVSDDGIHFKMPETPFTDPDKENTTSVDTDYTSSWEGRNNGDPNNNCYSYI